MCANGRERAVRNAPNTIVLLLEDHILFFIYFGKIEQTETLAARPSRHISLARHHHPNQKPLQNISLLASDRASAGLDCFCLSATPASTASCHIWTLRTRLARVCFARSCFDGAPASPPGVCVLLLRRQGRERRDKPTKICGKSLV